MSHDDHIVYQQKKVINNGGAYGGAYFIGMISAAVYFLQQTSTFWAGVLALLKALVWPAFIIYGLLKFLKM